MSGRKGFTIIELLIVIAVIAILVGIALPRFKGMQDEGRIAQAKGELRTLQSAVESYYIHQNNTYPTALSLLTGTSITPNLLGSALPSDPFNGTNNYGYATNGTNYYVIYSIGAGGNGSAAVSSGGVVTETNEASCIFVTNGATRDTQP
jgi:prepilin-type N-terminal cleavage/methylation domain-containing protein